TYKSRECSADAIVGKAGDSMDVSRALKKDERLIEKMIIQNRVSFGGALSCSGTDEEASRVMSSSKV
ncbi:UNVERIFIED_CONTAM: hypothetical protein NY603_28300, partial [Bacteroidetes bacterium 56_B9]